jgi:hypothetical protein
MSEMAGTVEVKLAGQDTFTPAGPNSFLVENAQVQTGDNGRVRLDISTGTIVRVAPSSIFTLISNTPTGDGLSTRLGLILGEMFIILKGGSLEVETPSGTASVRGSYMSVSYQPTIGSVRITCLEGHCSLSSSGGRVDITAGDSAEILGAGQPPQVGTMSDQDIQDWLNNNPEAQLVVPALENVVPAPIVLPPPSVYVPQVEVNEPVEEEGSLPTTTPTTVVPILTPPTAPPSLIPIVIVGNVTPTSATVGELVTFAVDVIPSAGGPTPTGTVQIIANGSSSVCTASLDVTGSVTCSSNILVSGNVGLIAEYLGDVNYLSAQSTPMMYSVWRANTTISMSNSPGPSVVNEPVSFTAVVSNTGPAGAGSPTGSVTFSDGADSCTATSAPWSCSIAFTSVGSKNVTAAYSGDANFYASSSAPVSHTVGKANTTLVITTYSDGLVDNPPVEYGMTIYVDWPGITTPTGSVTISDAYGNSCTATSEPWNCFITFNWTVGARDLTATYTGDMNFNGSTSAPVNVNVDW